MALCVRDVSSGRVSVPWLVDRPGCGLRGHRASPCRTGNWAVVIVGEGGGFGVGVWLVQRPPLFGRWRAWELGSFRCTARRRDRVLAGSGLPLCGVLSRLGGARPGWFGVVWSRARAGSHVGRGRGALASAGWRVVLLQSFGFWRGWCAGHVVPSASFQTKTWSRRWLPRHVLGAPRYPAFPPSRDGALRPRSRRPRGRGTGRPGL